MRAARVLVVAVGFLQLTCGPMPKDDPVELGERLRALSVPPDGFIVDTEPPSSAAWSITMRWTIKAGMSWAQYQSWATEHLRPEFTTVKQSSNKISFCKLLAGDSVTVHMELAAGPEPIMLRGTYVIAPD